jgi:hypothetical protein
MMLLNQEDLEYFRKADIARGIMASIYHCHVDFSLVAAFLTYWNVDGHTLITSQGEMGYPLHTIYDAMGIPFSGRLYEEYIPLPGTVRGQVKTLYSIYADMCPLKRTPKPGLVTIDAWVEHFFDDKTHSFGSLLSNCYADPADPLLIKMGLHIEVKDGRMSAFLGDHAMHYRPAYPSVVFRAAFIAAWLCTYCIPTEGGQYIRPEVFVMAVKLAEGSRRAIGSASLAFLYRSLDEFHNKIVAESLCASKCDLFVPGRFIMGWFASFMKDFPLSASLKCPTPFPPFVIDSVRREQMTLIAAHNIFWEFDDTGTSLRSLDFLGRSVIRIPKSGRVVRICDDHTQQSGSEVISIAATDLLISSTVGGILYRRGERYDNQVYCPHRFARMFNCDQHVPELDMLSEDTNRKTNRLDFPSYLTNSREESLELLGRRHLCFYRPQGHLFFVQTIKKKPERTMEYVAWYNRSFSFLQAPEFFCSRIQTPAVVQRQHVPSYQEGKHLRIVCPLYSIHD